MEPHSAAPHKRRSLWRGFLLTVSLFIVRSPPITAQLNIQSVPMNAVVGEDVLLLVHGVSTDPVIYQWFRGEGTDHKYQISTYITAMGNNIPGSAHTNRETIYSNGSLLFQNVTLNDRGMYTVQITYAAQPLQVASGNISVYPILTKPNITSNDSNPKEDMDSVTLLCGLDLQDASYMWFRDNQTLPEDDRLQLSQNNWNLTLHNVTRNDTGLYECRTWNPVSDLRSDPFLLNVLYGPDTPTISPSDSYYPPGATLNLSCQAASNPPAQYFWFINGSYEQAAQNLIIPNITVNNSGNYTCQAYNSATDSNTTTSKLITVSEFVTMPYIDASNTTVTENSGPVVLKCFTNHTNIRWIFNMQSLQLTDRMTLSPNNDTLTIDPVKKEDAGDYQCEVYNQVSNKISDPISLTVNPASASGSSGLSGGAIAGIVIGVVAGVALLAALVYFVFIRRSGGTSDQSDHSEHKLSASSHSQALSASNPVNEVAYSTLNFDSQQPKKLTPPPLSPTTTDTVYSEVKKK